MKKRVQFEGQIYLLEKGKVAKVRINRERPDSPRFEVRILSSGKLQKRWFRMHELREANDLAISLNAQGMDYGKVFRITIPEREALAEYQDYERSRVDNGRTCRSLKEILREALIYERARDASSFFSAAANHYIKEQAKQSGEAYAATTRLRVDRLKDIFGSENLASITSDAVQRAVERMTYRGKPISKSTQNQFVNLISAIYAHAIAIGNAVKNPTNGIMRHKINTARPEIVTPHQTRMILNYYAGHEPSQLASVVVGLFTGARAEERLKLRRRDIHLDEHKPYVRIDATISMAASLS